VLHYCHWICVWVARGQSDRFMFLGNYGSHRARRVRALRAAPVRTFASNKGWAWFLGTGACGEVWLCALGRSRPGQPARAAYKPDNEPSARRAPVNIVELNGKKMKQLYDVESHSNFFFFFRNQPTPTAKSPNLRRRKQSNCRSSIRPEDMW
jgi:hypothetical protein